ncbi:hypothetical protein [Chryseobacterium sp. CT-SW4]|uniref:hypothetical protein n=1 Tax=Chryseobacterium sp. SW-1 TaxID=3157343 RepID=UPI003B019BC2
MDTEQLCLPAPEEKPETDQPGNIPQFILNHEDEIIQYIKDKATKETLKSLAPLLEKLEEAVKQQQAGTPAAPTGAPAINYEEQLKNMQEISKEKIKAKELRITEKLMKLQAKVANINR